MVRPRRYAPVVPLITDPEGPTDQLTRCSWADGPWLAPYHDTEWGVPLHDDRAHFELLTLEGAQAGLSWLTVLKRREGYRRAFAGFDPAVVAAFDERDVARLMDDPGIIRHRQKVASAVTNAVTFRALAEEMGSFDAWVWDFVGGAPVDGAWDSPGQVPATTPLSEALSTELRRRGFRFVGPTVCYSYLQSAGLVNDHITGCFRYPELTRVALHR
jgi:DNA-3-methyladenine glycosylase I